MGYLTTFTIYDDGLHLLLKKGDDFCRKLHDAALEARTTSFGHGNHANLVKVQQSRHADDKTIYVHAGNTLMEMNAYADDTKVLARENPEFFLEMLKFMEREVRDLQRLYTRCKVAARAEAAYAQRQALARAEPMK